MEREKIKLALKCCSENNETMCKKCPYYNGDDYCLCWDEEMCKDALGLINEQEEEIDKLKNELRLKEEHDKATQTLCHSYRNDYWTTLKHLAELKQENEKLQQKLAAVLMCVNDTNGGVNVKKLQRQTIKKFATKLKEKLEDCSGCYIPTRFGTPTSEFAYNAKEVEKIIDELVEECI